MPSQVVKKPVPQFFFFTRFRWSTFQKITLPTKSWQIRLMVVLKNRRIRKKIYQKIPSLIQPIGHLSVSRSPNFNFTRKNLIQATIKSKNITILANERYLVKKYRNFIPFFFPSPFFSQHANTYTTVQII